MTPGKLFSALTFILLLFIFHVPAQTHNPVTGKVIDATTKAPLPFVSVSLKGKFIGTTTNDEGEFDFYIPADAANDTLVINYLGYKPAFYAVSSIDKPIVVALQSNLIELKEVVITPMNPTDYIRLAMRMIKHNYPDKPFETEAYYRKKFLENDVILSLDEAIFKTYYPNFQDTVKNQHQLLLYQKADAKRMAFMQAKRDAKNDKRKKKGKTVNDSDAVNIQGLDSPENLLSLDVIKSEEGFLDTTQFKHFDYEFDAPSSYQERELIVIKFKSDGKVDHMRAEGKIYIDFQTYAIVNLEYNADFIIPLLYRPLIFAAGYGVENPTFYKKVNYQLINGKWYPKNLQFNVDLKLERKYMFKANEHADFYIEGVFTVNKINVVSPQQIPLAKRFDPKKKMGEQVHNDEGISWNGMNIIKK